jgi:O-antigen/teichoic acid export membrane protein
LQQNLRSSFAWSGAESIVSLLTALLTALVVSRIISPAEFGLAALAWLFVSLAEVLVATPLADPLIQRRRLDSPVVDAAFTAMITTAAGIYLIILLAAPLLARLYDKPALMELLVVQGSTCLLTGLRGVPEALLARELRFRSLSIRSIVAKTAGALVALGAALLGAGAWSIVLGNVTFSFISTITIFSIIEKYPKIIYSPRHVVDLWSFGIYSLLDGFLWLSVSRVFNFLIGYFYGMQILGNLSFAFRINDSLCALLLAVTTRLALPIFSRIAEDPQRLERVFLQGTRAVGILIAPAFLGLAFVSPEMTRLALGPGWPLAAPSLVAVSLFSLLKFLCVLVHPTVKAIGKPALLIAPNVLGLVYVVAGSIMVRDLGFEAQLVVWTSWGVVFFMSYLRLLHRATGISWMAQLESLAPAAIASLGMCTVLLGITLIHPAGPAKMILLKVALGGLTYLLLVVASERSLRAQLFGQSAQASSRPAYLPIFFRRRI